MELEQRKPPHSGKVKASICSQPHGDPRERRSRSKVGVVLLRRPVRQGHPEGADCGFFPCSPESRFGLV